MYLNYEKNLIKRSIKMDSRVYWAGFKAVFKAYSRTVSDIER